MHRFRNCFAIAILWFALAAPCRLAAQDQDPDQTQPVPPANSSERQISLKSLIPNFISDQGRIYSFPARLVHGHNWIPTAVVLGTTAALIAVDNHEASYFRGTTEFHAFNQIFTSNATAVGTFAAPAALFAAGLIRKDSKMTRTALFAAEAIGDSEILATALKDITNRVRPSAIAPNGNFSDSWFEHANPPLQGVGSFPSGHTIAAFSVAAVVARRYGNHKWVPYVAYGAAALVGFSRLSLSAHFLSDVFVGGALGYSVSRFVVLRQ